MILCAPGLAVLRAEVYCFCGKSLQGYDHFGTEGCVLFDADAVAEWERQMRGGARPENPGQILQQIHRNLGFGDRMRPCPTCRARILRVERNNHVQCWSCTQHFCFACGVPLRSTLGHFGRGPGRCRQHGDA